jgi:hypothetical protein
MSTDLFVAWLEDWFRHATEDERLAYLVWNQKLENII